MEKQKGPDLFLIPASNGDVMLKSAPFAFKNPSKQSSKLIVDVPFTDEELQSFYFQPEVPAKEHDINHPSNPSSSIWLSEKEKVFHISHCFAIYEELILAGNCEPDG
jgi:hypothetical protein